MISILPANICKDFDDVYTNSESKSPPPPGQEGDVFEQDNYKEKLLLMNSATEAD